MPLTLAMRSGGDDDNNFELSIDSVNIPFESFRVCSNSSSEKPVRLHFYNSEGYESASVGITKEDYIAFSLEWMRYNFNFEPKERTPSEFLKDVYTELTLALQ
jgi:hypothetical protein